MNSSWLWVSTTSCSLSKVFTPYRFCFFTRSKSLSFVIISTQDRSLISSTFSWTISLHLVLKHHHEFLLIFHNCHNCMIQSFTPLHVMTLLSKIKIPLHLTNDFSNFCAFLRLSQLFHVFKWWEMHSGVTVMKQNSHSSKETQDFTATTCE